MFHSRVRWWLVAALSVGGATAVGTRGQAPATKGNTPAQAAAAKAITADDLKPGAKITIDLPALGASQRSGGTSPVQAMVMLPSNYDPKVAHPVLLHFGGDEGYPDCKTFAQLSDGKDFICVGVDYSTTNSAYFNAHAVLTLLAQATAIDKKSIFLGGSSNGAYHTTRELATPLATPFAGFICLIGGDEIPPPALGRRPILWYIGEDDKISRIENQQAAHATLQAAGCDTTFIVETGGVHDVIIKTLKPKFQEWIYPRLPAVQEVKQLEAQLTKATTDAAKLAIYRKLATSWLDLPIVTEAKQQVAVATAAPPATAPTKSVTAPVTTPTDPQPTTPTSPTVGESNPPVSANIRTWIGLDGKFRFDAELIEVGATKARFKKADGKVIEVAIDKFTPEDRALIEAKR